MKSEIRFFILTGDKIESTIQTANAAHVIQDHMQVILIQTNDRYVLDRSLTKLTENFKMNLESHHIDLEDLEVEKRVLAIDGPTLAMI
jgi:magnesium-transporting ATPase (P-type)